MRSGRQSIFRSETEGGQKQVSVHRVLNTGIVREMDYITGMEIKRESLFVILNKLKNSEISANAMGNSHPTELFIK